MRFEKMKKVIYLLCVGVMISLLGCGATEATKKTTDPASAMKVTAPAVILKNDKTMTKAEFEKIKNGMTYKQVTAIVGGPGELLVGAGNPSDPLYTVQFYGEGSMEANAQLMFNGGKLESKAQMGLK